MVWTTVNGTERVLWDYAGRMESFDYAARLYEHFNGSAPDSAPSATPARRPVPGREDNDPPWLVVIVASDAKVGAHGEAPRNMTHRRNRSASRHC